MQKNTKIYLTITNNVANFKVRLPWEWCNCLGITSNDRGINIRYKDECLVIEKQKEILFSDLSAREKVLQINKYKSLYRRNFDRQKDFISDIERYFKITYRTAYRYLKEEPTEEELLNVNLLQEQHENSRNINVIIKDGVDRNTFTVTLPSALAVLFLKGKTIEELGIKNIVEIYQENCTIPVGLKLEEDRMIIIEQV